MYTVAANPSNEMGGMNEVLYELYSLSGNRKYLDLATLFDTVWLLESLVLGRIFFPDCMLIHILFWSMDLFRGMKLFKYKNTW